MQWGCIMRCLLVDTKHESGVQSLLPAWANGTCFIHSVRQDITAATLALLRYSTLTETLQLSINQSVCKRNRRSKYAEQQKLHFTRIIAYPSRHTLSQPVGTRTARNNRSIQGVREDGEHCPGP
ncbi:hypothetical protein SSYM_2007 [Serratia symbiotica str. Tucson]|uniref:Uncharacterized protein n=1 Tax=Serratia symbiotica str. Tucson TaxID=914128 RepID=E9CNK4_9GAMM|nr:hypothetical protein SSYM_2007 [Serratia symbiotica str. Tucson]